MNLTALSVTPVIFVHSRHHPCLYSSGADKRIFMQKQFFRLCCKPGRAVRAGSSKTADDGDRGMSFASKGRHFVPDIILLCIRWYDRYAPSYRGLEKSMAKRSLSVDCTTIY